MLPTSLSTSKLNGKFQRKDSRKCPGLAVSIGFAALFVLINSAVAQVNTADILGTITDAGGAVMPGVRVTAQNLATNEKKVATSNAAGDYIFNLMPPGQYALTVEAPSFKK